MIKIAATLTMGVLFISAFLKKQQYLREQEVLAYETF